MTGMRPQTGVNISFQNILYQNLDWRLNSFHVSNASSLLNYEELDSRDKRWIRI